MHEVKPTPSADAPRIFTGIGSTYDVVGGLLSFGQDPRWRRALVGSVSASAGDAVLDVATGTGLVARELRRRYDCAVIGLDRSADMLAAAATKNGYVPLVRGRAEALPFADGSFDHLTFTYLLRYVDDPAAVIRELARVVRPGGRVAMLEFGMPRGPVLSLWRLYTRVGLPVLGLVFSRRWAAVGAFLGRSIERFYTEHPQSAIERYWRDAGLSEVRTRHMSLGAGMVMTGTKRGAASAARADGGTTEGPRGRGPWARSDAGEGSPPVSGWGYPRVERVSVVPPSDVLASTGPPNVGSAFYALRPGSWRDYWTLLHPPYTIWHLSFVVLGAALAPSPDPRVVAGALLAFFLGVGVAAHSFDELRGRPLGTRIPSEVLVALGSAGLIGAAALGVIGATVVGPALLAFVAIGTALVVLYAFELPLVHSDLGFALAWGGFPVLTAAFATGAPAVPAVLAAAAASLLSLAQRRLSTPVRRIRRKAVDVRGEVRYRDGSHEVIDRAALIASPEAALRLLWLAVAILSLAALIARWSVG